jgi:hypothetical protein
VVSLDPLFINAVPDEPPERTINQHGESEASTDLAVMKSCPETSLRIIIETIGSPMAGLAGPSVKAYPRSVLSFHQGTY